MKAKLFFYLMAVGPGASAQGKELINETFTINTRNWDEDEHKTFADGVYSLHSPEEGDQAFSTFFIDPLADYDLLADFVFLGGGEDSAYGLSWGTGTDDYNLFLLTQDGEYLVYSGSFDQMKGWKPVGSIKAGGQVNRLKVEQRGGKLSFYINETRIEERKSFPFFGSYTGFVMLSQTQVTVDNFIFRQNQTIVLSEEAGNFEKKENLGPGINSQYDDLGPLISTDGRTIYFARQFVPENVGGKDDSEDIWVSHWENGGWGPARNMGHVINTSLSDNLVAVSSDNNTFLFEEPDGLKARHRSETGWSPFEKLDFNVKNETNHFVACLSADGKAIIFSAKLKNNLYHDPKHDETDLFVSVKEKNNKWSLSVNLGSKINSAGEDTSPFLSADGKALYFATNGRPGFGDQDIFVAQRTGGSWTDWSEPKNLGPAINTAAFDAYFTIPASGDYAYFVSYNGGFGEGDIFRIKLHAEAKPNPVVLLKGKALNSVSAKPLAASIIFENLVNGAEVGEARTDPRTGSYQIVLPFGINYGVRAKADGYYAVHENLDLVKTEKYQEIERDISMVPIAVGETIKLNNIFFEPGSAVLKAESSPELDHLVIVLKDNGSIIIELGGHTDNIGDETTLMKLSQDRVASVKEYLVTHGIETSRILGRGHGATKPLAPSDTEENRKLNRRVEFKIVKK